MVGGKWILISGASLIRYHMYIKAAHGLAMIYIEGLIDENIIGMDILQPIILHIDEKLNGKDNIADYLTKDILP